MENRIQMWKDGGISLRGINVEVVMFIYLICFLTTWIYLRNKRLISPRFELETVK